jgi:hypothetical protein
MHNKKTNIAAEKRSATRTRVTTRKKKRKKEFEENESAFNQYCQPNTHMIQQNPKLLAGQRPKEKAKTSKTNESNQ